jgi:hypothetical protein
MWATSDPISTTLAGQALGMTAAREMVSLRERTSGTSEKQAALAALYETHFERVSRYISVRIGDF